ncbi:MAG: hypothetical protein WCJ24_00305 [Candidatus Saccharibacteria bacterium]
MAKSQSPKNEVKIVSGPRKLKAPTYNRARYHKRIKHPGPKLISSWKIFKNSIGVLRQNQRLFGGITVIYALVSVILVRGFNSVTQLSDTKAALQAGHSGTLSTGFTLIGNLFSNSSGASTPAANTYQSILLIIMSLVFILALRQVYSPDRPKEIRIKQAFYGSTYPLIPFVLVLLVITLELIPLVIGATIYSAVIGNGLAVGLLEKSAWVVMFFVLAVWSIYMLTSAIFALYIVTLPDMTPIKALRSAKQLVQYRRWTVMRKLLFLPLIIMLMYGLVMLPIVLWLTPLAEWLFFIFGLAILGVVHSYIYALYRELL